MKSCLNLRQNLKMYLYSLKNRGMWKNPVWLPSYWFFYFLMKIASNWQSSWLSLGKGRVKLWFLVQSYFKIQGGSGWGMCSKCDEQDLPSSCRKHHTAGSVSLVSPAHTKCRPHFMLGSAVWYLEHQCGQDQMLPVALCQWAKNTL